MAHTFQESLPDGSTVISVIFGSDKTMLSTLSGDKITWPVYLSIGNISKVKRRFVRLNGLILIGLLPRSPNCLKTHTIMIVYQESMATMLRPLEEPVKSGIKVLCADSRTRHVYPRIASFLADYLEQYNVTGVKYGWCPHCEIEPDDISGFNCRLRQRHIQRYEDM
ncbi:hypothetical protein K440DRAFT_547484 [Wilcoxina mikolae CBS 423.85]|nr:hypothetical protein K440DRAFT_547484 [Wilcoxina mikolae CBS 423.85]